MCRCEECGKVFSEPIKVADDYGYDTCLGHFTAYQYSYECPNCGSDKIVEVEQCTMCDGWFSLDEIGFLPHGWDRVCDKCYDEYSEDNE